MRKFLIYKSCLTLNYRSLYNRWIHQRCCQSKEIWHNFWWQHRHNVPISKARLNKGCKALPRVVWKNDAAFVILTCLPENDKKLFYVIFPHEKLGFIPLALPIAQFKFKCIIFFWKFRKKASFQSIKYEQVSYWPNLKLHNCLYPSNGFYMGDSEGMALECEPNGLSIAGQYQCLFWVYSSNLPILDCTIWTSKNVSNYHKF